MKLLCDRFKEIRLPFIKLQTGSKYSQLSFADWVFFFLSALICYLLFSQVDLRITAEHSLVLLDANITDFYSACQEWNGAYAANYLPSTYLAFALWNLPMKKLGVTPDIWGTSGTIMFWYKLLPIIIYVLSSYVLYSILKEHWGFSKVKAYMGAYIFLTTPIAFFSQFIFCQYDIFTVFFMLLGLKHYFAENNSTKNKILFGTYFGVAITFKYYALLIFLVFLLVRQKKLINICLNVFLAGIPYLIEYGLCIFWDGESFRKAAMGFSALEYVKNAEISVGSDGVRILPLLLLVIVAWAYFTYPNNRHDEIKYALFFSCGICFALFSFMTWHPQWILFAGPFLALSIIIHKHYDVFLLLDILFVIMLYIYMVNRYAGNVDENMLRNGVFFSVLKYREIGTALTMKDIYVFSDTNLLYTVMVAILAVSFIFKHPRYCFDEIGTEFSRRNSSTKTISLKWILRIRLFIAVFAFVIPALMCLPTMLQQKVVLWSREDTYATEGEFIPLTNNEFIQPITIPGDVISEVRVKTAIFSNADNTNIDISIIEYNSKSVLETCTIANDKITHDGQSLFAFNNFRIDPTKKYALKINLVGEPAEIYIKCAKTPTNDYQLGAVQQSYEGDYMYINGEPWYGYYCIVDVLGE